MIILKLVLLGTQLEKLKAINVEKLQKELQEEREKNLELKEKLRQKQKSVSSKLQRYHFMCYNLLYYSLAISNPIIQIRFFYNLEASQL